MAMGRRREERQEALFIATDGLPKSPGHPFIRSSTSCWPRPASIAGSKAAVSGTTPPKRARQPSIPPGVYFRMLLVGYFEGLDSQRGIAWRCADSLSLRQFLGIPLDESTPDHSTLTNTRNRLPGEVFDEVFQFVLRIANDKKLLAGKTVGVDSTMLEADAAMKSIVRRDTGEDWKQYVTRLMREDGTIRATKSQPTRRFAATIKSGKTSGSATRTGSRRAIPTAASRR